MTKSNFLNELESFKQDFDPYLKSFLDKKTKNITNYTKDLSVTDYINYAKKIILTGGKRIRPYIAYLMYRSLGGNEDKKILNFLVALEVFHSFCLIHDDIMDKSRLRHGISTSQIYITNKLKEENRKGDLSHIANSQTILLGDIIFSWSQEIISLNNDFDEKILQKVKKYFYKMVDEVIVGQMIDIDITTRTKVSKETIDEKTRLKTAGYSFIYPSLIGAALAKELSPIAEKFCKELGLELGMAFQSQDDIFDTDQKNKDLGPQKKIIEDNLKNAKRIISNMKMEEEYEKKFLDLVEIIEKRTF